MDMPVTLVGLAGSVALLLWGTHMVQTGIQRAFGARLRMVLDRALRTRLRAFLAGVGVTAALQSSTATGLMVTGFAAGGVVDLVPALAVMLGANVGTTLIVQLLSFDVASLAPALVLAGVVLFRRNRSAHARDSGRIFIGLGLMLIALHQLVGLVTPYEDAPSLRIILGLVSSAPLVTLMIGAAATWLAHSSVAIILVTVSLASRGVMAPDTAFAMVLGANLGTALNPILEGGVGDDPAAKRLPIGNMLVRLGGAAVALPVLPWLGRWLVTLEPEMGRAVADFHTAFNVALALIGLPLLDRYAALLRRWLPTRIDPADPTRPLYLDPAALDTPIVALGSAAREALRLADVLDAMLEGAVDAFAKADRRVITGVRRYDDILDALNVAIRTYLTSLDGDALSDGDHRRLAEILSFVSNLEQAGDATEKSLLPLAAKRLNRGLPLSVEGRDDIVALIERLRSNLRTAASLLVTDDVRGARLLAEEKRNFREIESRATRGYLEDLRLGRAVSADGGAWHLDVVREAKRINAHLVAASAYPILERQGELLSSRIAGDE
ncbi:Na/Pi cotransporter family protein [Lichenihabitans sp. Uapishka_5]|uniref:Na/Pi cotransporter family protein n=1 Tax=Lichenihabitans sp. Uapishka_5 TaxID=3037302 RepID=UPI0029E80995|nr:Na/Pi cotransporter family protein [Lichenihabitans sp. Uapishka_5]MDX7952530.1 Na/Pi cotransporter family protein [Lichenihabitans sp. Uapishka_5]